MKKLSGLIKKIAFTLAFLLTVSISIPLSYAAYTPDADEQPASEQQAEQDDAIDAFKQEVLALINLEREKAGVAPLEWMEDLCDIADIRAEEASDKFGHTRPDGTSCFTIFKENAFTYKAAGENLSFGYSDPGKLVRAWMNSASHRSNVLDPDFQFVAVGYYDNGHRVYCSLLFYTPKT